MRLIPLPEQKLNCHGDFLDLSKPQIMGILNVTPDSFSDGGIHQQKEQAFSHAMQMITDGASIIDIGGESTRPGAQSVAIEEEIKRVIPVVELLAKEKVILSIDTSEPQVIKAAVEAGAHIWNDVRALTRPNALETAVMLDIPVVMMHMRGEPTTMNQLAQYENVVQDVIAELKQRIDKGHKAGLKPENIIIDPGFGFAKNAEHNFQLLNELWRLTKLGYPLLSGLSRKRFIGHALSDAAAHERVVGSVTGHLLSIQQGASIVRSHDVKQMHEAICIWQAMQHTAISNSTV